LFCVVVCGVEGGVGLWGLALCGVGYLGSGWFVIDERELLVMQRLKVVVLALLGVVVLGAFASSMASATELPVILDAKGKVAEAVKFSGTTKSETTFAVLKGFAVVLCKEITAEGETEAGKPLGSFHIHWKKCDTSLGPCKGLSDVKEEILALGSFHFVFDSVKPKPLGLGILFLLEHVHFECEAFGIMKLILVLGEVICLVTPPNVLGTNLEINCITGKEAGDPGEVAWWLENAKKEFIEVPLKNGLLGSEDDKTYNMASQGGTASVTAAEKIEVMA
jgi:hypothetical protein